MELSLLNSDLKTITCTTSVSHRVAKIDFKLFHKDIMIHVFRYERFAKFLSWFVTYSSLAILFF